MTASIGIGAVELAWNRNTESSFKEYRVSRAEEGGPFAEIARGLDAPVYSDHNIQTGKHYRYQVVAVDQDGHRQCALRSRGDYRPVKIIRYSLNPNIPAWTTDAHPDVRQGDFDHLPSGARLLPPCSPSKIVCVGRNYTEHAKEMGVEVPAEPTIFLKPPSSLIASGDAIVYPRLTQRLDYEGELGVVIARRARNVKSADAAAYILGYTPVNDVTARDLQRKDGQWTRGKGFDTFCPVGPYIVPRDEVNLNNLQGPHFRRRRKETGCRHCGNDLQRE